MLKKDEKTKTERAPDPELAKAAAHGDPLAKALVDEVTKEERYPMTTAVVARRKDPHTVPDEVVRALLSAGGHAQHCQARAMSSVPCGCGWGPAAKDAEDLLGITAEREAAKAKADEEIRERSKQGL